MTPKLYKATDVCEMVQLQPYVLRSWEKEFPGIGVQKSDSQRLYRQADVEQVLRIKQLVFGEGLTLAGARRRLEENLPVAAVAAREPETIATARAPEADVADVIEALASDARTRIANVRQGLQAILTLLSQEPGTTVVVVDEYQLQPPAPSPKAARPLAAHGPSRSSAPAKPAEGKATAARRKRASV